MKTNCRTSHQFSKLYLPAMLIFSLLLAMFIAKPVKAAGLLIADGGLGGVLEIKTHEVNVSINNGIAVTKVTQVFHNTENRQVEALYTFPVPKKASVSNFSMWINGKEMVGEVLEKERARKIYDSYKRVRKDPGLLEQVNYKQFEMRIFPIPAKADQKVQITYYQELDVDHNEVTYVYPLATLSQGKMTKNTAGRFTFQLETKSLIPITHMKSPSHGQEISVIDQSQHYKMASLEQKNGSLAADVVVHYGLARPHSGVDLITSRMIGEDGFFYITITAGQDLVKLDTGMDYIFLLDVSGSMANDSKLPISRRSLIAFINELDANDRFDLMSFNVQPQTLFNQLREVSSATRKTAEDFLQSRAATGGTILAPALMTAYKYGDPDRQLNVVILSDGMTEQKERNELMRLIGQRPANARVFCIGIGNEINRPLLEQLAEDSGGLAAFISGGDDFQRQAKAFRRKLMRPAAGPLSLSFEGIRIFDLVPVQLPNLYYGAPLRVYGRYSGNGNGQVTLKGEVQGREFKQTVTLPFAEKDSSNPEIERMWAQKKIDQLLRGTRDQETIDTVVALGEDFSIVTEYTSFLVLENDAEYQRWKIDRKNASRLGRDRAAQEKRKEVLTAMRQKALQNLGPQTVTMNTEKESLTSTNSNQPGSTKPDQPVSQPTIQQHQSRDVDFGASGGSGPVGPLFIGLAMLMRRRKQQK